MYLRLVIGLLFRKRLHFILLTTIQGFKVDFFVFCSICLKSGNMKPLVVKWPCCFKDIFIYIYIYIYDPRKNLKKVTKLQAIHVQAQNTMFTNKSRRLATKCFFRIFENDIELSYSMLHVHTEVKEFGRHTKPCNVGPVFISILQHHFCKFVGWLDDIRTRTSVGTVLTFS